MTDAQRVIIKDAEQWLMSSDVLMGRVRAFCMANRCVFAGREDPDASTPVFRQYSALTKCELEAHLASNGVSREEFVDACRATVADSGAERSHTRTTPFITAMTDYDQFKQLMTLML